MPVGSDAHGILGISNCLAAVPEDEYWAIESFNKYTGSLNPGLTYVGFDVCGMCISFKRVSNRIHEISVNTQTKTLDNTFVTLRTNVQVSVESPESIYKLEDVQGQVDSYVSDIIRSSIPHKELDNVFSDKEEIANAVQDKLTEEMTRYLFKVHRVLITDIMIAQDVVRSLNEVNKQKRLKEAQILASEAQKVRTVMLAEAEADAAELQGQGIARERAMVIQGLCKNVGDKKADDEDATLGTNELTQMLLVTQYYDTLRHIGSQKNMKTFLLPASMCNTDDSKAQVQLGMLQADAILEEVGGTGGPFPGSPGGTGGGNMGMGGMGAVASYRPQQRQSPAQQRMQSPARKMQSALGLSPGGARSPYTPPPVQQAPYTPPQRAPPPIQQAVPAQPRMLQMEVEVPANAAPGSVLTIQAPGGQMIQVQVPMNVSPGMKLKLAVPI